MWTKAVISVALIVGLGCSTTGKQRTGNGELPLRSGELRTGVFAGPVVGLKYQTRTVSGVTNEKGGFQYRDGEAVTFLVGELVLGTAKGADRVNVAELVPRVDGDIEKVSDPWVTNLAQFIQTLDQDGNAENGVTIAPQAHAVIGRQSVNFNQSESIVPGGRRGPMKGDFSKDPAVTSLLAKLNNTPGVFTAGTPRQLRTPEAVRNELRRNIRGIIKTTDVKIPTRDGSFVHADVFRPADDGHYPAVMAMTPYGKAFQRGCICNAKDAENREEWEDRWFSGNPEGLPYENHETVDTAEWVPKGYVVVRIGTRGDCNSPGMVNILSLQEAEDYYDAVEWAAKQPWSNGNVGLWGQSYNAMNQSNVAVLQPPHLKAMIAIGADANEYEEVAYHGGLRNDEFIVPWWEDEITQVVCGEHKIKDSLAIIKAHPFNDPAIYGPKGSTWIASDLSKITVPLWVVMPTVHRNHIHQLGGSELYIRATAAKDKKLDIVEDWTPPSYGRATVAKDMAFFDYWLKGVKNGIMDTPSVHILMRTGNGNYYDQYENEWPIARTQYTKLYLDASASQWEGDGRRKDFLRLSRTAANSEKRTSYSAQVGDPGTIWPSKPRGTPCWVPGMSFVTDPMPEDMVLAGYMKLGLWVSSTSSDMDLYAAMRVIDEQNREVNYSNLPTPGDAITNIFPVGWGALKVSHRKLDPKRTTEYWPYQTHAEADYARLKKDEIVPIEVGLWPSTAVVKKGYRIRLDLQPYEGCGGGRHWYDPSYHTGAENTIFTGPNHPSYLQLPLIPPKVRP